MNFICNFPFFSIILSFVCAVTSFALSGKAARYCSIFLLSVSICLSSATLFYNVSTGESFTFMMGHFPAPWGNEIMAGYIEPFFDALFAVVLVYSVFGGAKKLETDIDLSKMNLYYIMVDLAHVALLALCYTNDIFTGYVFVEICTLSSCALLMIRSIGRALAAATRYMIFSLMGSGLFLIGCILLYCITGHLLFPNIKESVAALWAGGEYTIPLIVSIGLMVSGLAIKSGLFPFHYWMPDTYSSATPGSSGILSGVISKAYIILLIKVIYRAVGIEVFMATGIQNLLLVLGVAGMIFGSVSAIHAKGIKKMVAYSSAAQIGYIYMGLGMGTPAALLAAFYQIIAHAITKPVLFQSAGALCDVSQEKQEFSYLRGAAHRNPLAGIVFLCGSLSIIGIPLFTGFIPKLYFATSAFALNWQTYVVLIALAISTLLNVLYFLYTAIKLFLPERLPVKGGAVVWRGQSGFAAASIGMILLNLIIGVHSQPLTMLLRDGIELFMK